MESAGPTPTWIKIREGISGTRNPRPTPGTASPGFQCQEDKSPQLLAAKTSRDLVDGRNCWSLK